MTAAAVALTAFFAEVVVAFAERTGWRGAFSAACVADCLRIEATSFCPRTARSL